MQTAPQKNKQRKKKLPQAPKIGTPPPDLVRQEGSTQDTVEEKLDNESQQRVADAIANHDLSPEARALLQLMALVFVPASEAHLFFSASALTTPNDAWLAPLSQTFRVRKEFKALLESLCATGLVGVAEQNRGYTLNPYYRESFMRLLVDSSHWESTRTEFLEISSEDPELRKSAALCQIRCLIYDGAYEEAENLFDRTYFSYWRNAKTFFQHALSSFDSFIVLILNNPLDTTLYLDLPMDLRHTIMIEHCWSRCYQLTPRPHLLPLIEHLPAPLAWSEIITLFEHLLLSGRFSTMHAALHEIGLHKKLLSKNTAAEQQRLLTFYKAALALLEGNDAQSRSLFSTVVPTRNKKNAKRNNFRLHDNYGVGSFFFLFALLKSSKISDGDDALFYIDSMSSAPPHFETMAALLKNVILMQRGQPTLTDDELASLTEDVFQQELNLFTPFYSLALQWLGAPLKKFLPQLKQLTTQLDSCQLNEVSQWVQAIARRHGDDSFPNTSNSDTCDWIKVRPRWQYALEALAQIEATTTIEKHTQRLCWSLTLNNEYCFENLEPRLQKQTKTGGWSKGRKVALSRLADTSAWSDDFANSISDKDRAICKHITEYTSQSWRYYNSTDYYFTASVVESLVDHPAVYWHDAPEKRIDITAHELALQVSENKGTISLRIDHPLMQENAEASEILLHALDVGHNLCVTEDKNRLLFTQLQPVHRRLFDVIGNGLQLPKHAEKDMMRTLATLAPHLAIHSELPALHDTVQQHTANNCLYLQLRPVHGGLSVHVYVRPHGTTNYAPGIEPTTLMCTEAGKTFVVKRDLQTESACLLHLVASCPELQESDSQWDITNLESCMTLLDDLKTYQESHPDRVQLEWPEGQPYAIRDRIGFKSLALRITKKTEWLGIDGDVVVDGEKVMTLKTLLAHSNLGRFVPLGSGEFLCLSQQLHKQLAKLKRLALADKASATTAGIRLHSLAAHTLDDFESASIKGNKSWQMHLKNQRELSTETLRIPPTLQADLRDYQHQGFLWLARLDHLGVGACLADDMGLGKTLQAMAMLLHKAAHGPSLVVAPASVALNWHAEILRFAPTLNVKLCRDQQTRQRMLADLAPFDVVILSYGLLQRLGANELSQTHWQCAILDEAQAIKNPTSQRAQAAFQLKAEFRIALTGTPIENHLGEFWSLFEFVNPGLFGKRTAFNQRFATPIENGDHDAREHLQALVRPYILRRTKNEVLSALPPRTEVVMNVTLNDDERIFYEAVRQHAVEMIDQMKGIPGKNLVRILAEITHLRRACCHPSLVKGYAKLSEKLPKSPKPSKPATSSKMELFASTIDDLRQNGHKALVFSQFVGHLSLLRQVLDAKKIHYHYLDGKTSMPARKKAIEAFQGGDGEFFLISLKAGGVGLNLTAADYVIHMDPWWNPAVEDQASDRAHRIGQTRPVTVYRFICSDTIEEKIIALHQHKRALADGLLQGSDQAGKLDANALLALIRT